DLLMRTNDSEEAITAYTTALDQKPDNIRALTGLSNAYQAQGMRLQALETLRTAANFAPSDQRLIARYLAYEERYGDADIVLNLRRELAASQPENLQNRAALAMLMAEEGEVAEALGMLDGLVEDFGDRREVAAARAQVLRADGRADEGEAAIRDYIAGRSEQADAADYMLLGRYLLTTRKVNESIAAYRQATTRETADNRPASRELADVLFNFGQNEQATELYRGLFEQADDNNRQRLGLRLAETLLKLQKIDEAKAVLDDKRLQQDATADALRAMLFMQQNQPEKAMEFIDRSLGKNNQNAMTFLQRAQLLSARPQTLEKALDDLEQALALQPKLVQAMALQARVQLALGRNEDAARSLRNLLEQAPGNNEARLQLARLYAASRDIEAADDLINEGLEINPENPAWLQLSAGLAAQQGNTNQAIRKLETLMDTNPNAQALGQLSLLYLDIGKPGAADALLGENASLLGASAALQAVRGRALSDLGKPDQAKRVFELAMQRSQSQRELNDVLRQMIEGLGRDEAIQLADATTGIGDPSWVGLAVAGLMVTERE
ncbi:MAG: tetratricopeptide repeat protein, partial [Pseudomonadota bacterium]